MCVKQIVVEYKVQKVDQLLMNMYFLLAEPSQTCILIWDALEENVKSARKLWRTTDMFESRISAGAKEKLLTRASGKLDAETTSSWSYDMESHAKKCVERCCEFANKTTQQYKVATPCMDDLQFKEEENESVGELSTVCSQIVLKCLYLARIGRPDILCSVSNLARAVTKCTKSCDKRLVRLISHIHHTCEYWQYCYVGKTAQQCRLGLFQDSDFCRRP